MRPVVAIAGQPNCGKTTLFNRLTGSRAKVANYPGITVDRKEAALSLPDGREAVLLDIPGAYSLSARTREEQIAITAIAGLNPFREPDAVIVVVDGTQLARSLYLVLQVLELRLRAVVALNMADVVRKNGMRIDLAAMSEALGVPVVSVSALKGEGLEQLRAAVGEVLASPDGAVGRSLALPDDGELGRDLAAVEPFIPRGWGRGDAERRRTLAAWALLSVDQDDELWDVPAELRAVVDQRRAHASQQGRDLDLGLVGARYAWIDRNMPRFVARMPLSLRRVTDAVDRVLIHPTAGLLVFLVILGALFESLFTWSEPLIDAVSSVMNTLAVGVRHAMPPGILQSFLADGLIAGVGAVLAFLPQILLLFLFIGLMEDSGYMARAAFLMDRIMKAIGLTGRAFVPMLSGFACAIPAIMATRTMERQRDRMLTMMVVPIMTCSARLPVYTLIIGALYPGPGEAGGQVGGVLSLQALLMVAMYAFSTVMALGAAAVLGRTLFRGTTPPLLLELPPYRLPLPRSVLRMMWERSRVFVSEAGSVILACTVVLWALLSFPRDEGLSRDFRAEQAPLVAAVEAGTASPEARLALQTSRREEASERLRGSYGGRLGQLLEPVIAPLGFDWKIGVGLIGSFAAREVFVSTMAVVYGIGDEADEASAPLRTKLQAETWPDGRRVYTPLVGLSLMVFFALAAQCMSTLAVVRRETASLRWPAFLFAYMTGSAWLMAWLVYQGGRLLGF